MESTNNGICLQRRLASAHSWDRPARILDGQSAAVRTGFVDSRVGRPVVYTTRSLDGFW